MSHRVNHLPIAVAVFSGDERAALALGAAEAHRSNCPLRLVHAVDPLLMTTAGPAGALSSYPELDNAAHTILNRAAHEVFTTRFPEIPIEQVVRHGPASSILADESSASRLVVLERRRSPAAHLFTGSTSIALASRAQCPVMWVPEAWDQESLHGLVVVGVDHLAQPESVLTKAFEEARLRQADLLVLHAWCLAWPYEEVLGTVRAELRWRANTGPSVEQAIDQCSERSPEVKATLQLEYGCPVEVLAELTSSADLLVLGRRTRNGPLPIGSIARAMIRESRCPVMVLPLSDGPDRGRSHEADEISPQL